MPKKNKIDQINQDRELELKQIDKQAEQNTSKSIKKVLQFIEEHKDDKYIDFIQNILKSRENKKIKNEYMEEHHILPRSLGGKDEPSNLIWLFPEEHYVAHRLLYLENPNNEKLAYAYLCLNSFGDSHNLPQELNIRNLDKLKTLSPLEYGTLRRATSKIKSISITCVETGEVFSKINDLKRKRNIPPESLYDCLIEGKEYNKKHYIFTSPEDKEKYLNVTFKETPVIRITPKGGHCNPSSYENNYILYGNYEIAAFHLGVTREEVYRKTKDKNSDLHLYIEIKKDKTQELFAPSKTLKNYIVIETGVIYQRHTELKNAIPISQSSGKILGKKTTLTKTRDGEQYNITTLDKIINGPYSLSISEVCQIQQNYIDWLKYKEQNIDNKDKITTYKKWSEYKEQLSIKQKKEIQKQLKKSQQAKQKAAHSLSVRQERTIKNIRQQKFINLLENNTARKLMSSPISAMLSNISNNIKNSNCSIDAIILYLFLIGINEGQYFEKVNLKLFLNQQELFQNLQMTELDNLLQELINNDLIEEKDNYCLIVNNYFK